VNVGKVQKLNGDKNRMRCSENDNHSLQGFREVPHSDEKGEKERNGLEIPLSYFQKCNKPGEIGDAGSECARVVHF
jgi:hypothetical protein